MDDDSTMVIERPAPEPAARRPRWGLRIALATIGVVTLGCLLAMLVVWRTSGTTEQALSRHHRVVDLAIAQQTGASSSQLVDPTKPTVPDLVTSNGFGDDPTYQQHTDVLRFVPGEIVTRITVESDGQRSVVLVQVQDTGTSSLSASCVESSTVLPATCADVPGLAEYAR
ncbi:MAG: hypothetical protein U0R68_17885 [Candidatus Nanopelagicales bacterium]